MRFTEVINIIEESMDFKEFIRTNPHYYLVHVFRIVDHDTKGNWQIGYYSKDTDKIVVFEHNNDLVMMHNPEEALKKEEYIQELEIDDSSISDEDALQTCDSIVKEHYPKELPNKKIFLLQNLPEYGQVWNVTLVTLAFNLINVKIEANSGNVLKHSKESLMQWGKRE